MPFYFELQTPIGLLTAVSDASHLSFLGLHRDLSGFSQRLTAPIQQLQEELIGYFSGENVDFKTPLAFQGTAFQRQVWKQLQTIEYGQTQSYSEMAKNLQKSKASRAVGNAIGKNPFLIIVPCHRVIRSDGNLGGFSAGIERKKWLLEHEIR